MLLIIPDDHCLYVKYILSVNYIQALEYAIKLYLAHFNRFSQLLLYAQHRITQSPYSWAAFSLIGKIPFLLINSWKAT